MSDKQSTVPFFPCSPGRERCAVDGVECECERIEEESTNTLTKNYTLGGSTATMIPLRKGSSYAGIEGPCWVLIEKGNPPRRIEFSALESQQWEKLSRGK